MSLNLPRILPQITRLSQVVTERRRLLSEALPHARKGLTEAGQLDVEALRHRVTAAGDRWPGAAPSGEPVDSIFPAPSLPQRFSLIGADGSQVYPDRHAAAFYYLINIGSISTTYGSGETPNTEQKPSLFFGHDEVYDAQGRPVQPAIVNLRRDVAEMQALADAAEKCDTNPCVALLDNSLLLWMTLEAEVSARREVDQRLSEYLQAMDRLRALRVALAGFIDRPRTGNTLALIHLAQLAENEISAEILRENPYRNLTDLDLFSTMLPAGARSARFIYTSPLNRDFERAGHQVQYFYLNTGPEEQIIRVEIPAWVGEQPGLLDQLHAIILHDCSTTKGFPFVLIRAHELAVVTARERQLLEQQIEQTVLLSGETPAHSQKSITKGWIQGRKRHRL